MEECEEFCLRRGLNCYREDVKRNRGKSGIPDSYTDPFLLDRLLEIEGKCYLFHTLSISVTGKTLIYKISQWNVAGAISVWGTVLYWAFYFGMCIFYFLHNYRITPYWWHYNFFWALRTGYWWGEMVAQCRCPLIISLLAVSRYVSLLSTGPTGLLIIGLKSTRSGQSRCRCPNPQHLKHLLFLTALFLSIFLVVIRTATCLVSCGICRPPQNWWRKNC